MINVRRGGPRGQLCLVACYLAAACGTTESPQNDAPTPGGPSVATGGVPDGPHSGGLSPAAGGLTAGGAAAGGAGGLGADSGGGGRGSVGSGGASPNACLDAHGHTMLYRTAPEGPTWDSLYWHDASHPVPFGTADPADPRGLANRRGTGEVVIEGDGTLTMTGSQPRFYLGTSQSHPFKNVEITVYYRRLEDDGTAYAGLVVGARSGPDGHSDRPCTATTYYARMRHDGDLDVAKELEHPEAAARAAVPIWNGHELPGGQWLGMKYLVTNMQNDGAVRLRVYWDLTFGENGGKWELLLDELDDGGWAPPHDCDFAPDHVVLDGGGVVFLRNTGLFGQGAGYRALSVREVDPNAPCAE